MKRAKTHTGTYYCPECLMEFELFGEASLKCDTCKGPLLEGSLDDFIDEAHGSDDDDDPAAGDQHED